MDQRLKKFFSVLFAILVGVAVVFSAIRGGSTQRNGNVSVADPNAWKQTLSVVPQKYALGTMSIAGANVEVPSVSATTTTDLIARKLLLAYIAAQNTYATTTLSDAAAASIAASLSQEVTLPKKISYGLGDLNISSDNSAQSNLSYKNSFNSLIAAHVATEQKENELMILVSAMNTNDATKLKRLESKASLYQQLIKSLIALKTPSLISSLHLELVQSYETLRSATVGLEKMLVDPAIGVAALAEYKLGVESLAKTEADYHNFVFANQ